MNEGRLRGFGGDAPYGTRGAGGSFEVAKVSEG